MNIGTTTTPTDRGQIVIPADYREILGINSQTVLSLKLMGGGIYIQPMTLVPNTTLDDSAFLEFLKEHRGFMAGDENFNPVALKTRRKLEIARAKRLKRLW